MTAHALLSADTGLRIVMLEAREVCSGATGRNGGHCKPDVGDLACERRSSPALHWLYVTR